MYRDRSTVIRKIVIISALLLILGGGIFALHSVYTVRTVYVEGNVHYTEDEIKKIVMSGCSLCGCHERIDSGSGYH